MSDSNFEPTSRVVVTPSSSLWWPCTFYAHTRTVLCISGIAFWLFNPLRLFSDDCEPKRNCDATRDCSLQVDTRSCGHDVSLPFNGHLHFNDPICEAAKGAQNAGYKVAHDYCETQKAAEKFDCERVKTQQRVACEAGLDGPFSCRPDEVLTQLRTSKQNKLTDFEMLSGAASTPIKKLGGQLSWRETACQGSGTGQPYINSQRSTDGFCTVDVKLLSFSIQGQEKPPGDRYLRLEILPGGKASSICANRTISTLDTIRFGGPLKIDKHFPGERWLEVHVTDDFDFVPSANAPVPPSTLSQNPPAPPAPKTDEYAVQRGDCLAKIAEREYGRQVWPVIYRANRKQIKDPDLIYPGQVLTLPPRAKLVQQSSACREDTEAREGPWKL